MTDTTKKLTLDEIKILHEAGQLHADPAAPETDLPDAFWADAKVVSPGVDISSEAVARALEGVTPGPWLTDGMTGENPRLFGKSHRIKAEGLFMAFVAGWQDNPNDAKEAEANARFIAWSRAAAPALSAALTKAQSEIAIMSKALDAEELAHGLSTTGGMWRFWRDKADEVAKENVKLRAERDRQYAENVHRIAEQAKAEAERDAALKRAEQAEAELAALERLFSEVEGHI